MTETAATDDEMMAAVKRNASLAELMPLIQEQLARWPVNVRELAAKRRYQVYALRSEGKKFKEISEMMRVTESAARSIFNSARRQAYWLHESGDTDGVLNHLANRWASIASGRQPNG